MPSVAPVVTMTSVRVRGEAVKPFLMGGHCLAQLQNSLAGCVLVHAGSDGGAGSFPDLQRSVLVRKTLAEVDRTCLRSEGGHLLKDGDAEPAVRPEEIGSRAVRCQGAGARGVESSRGGCIQSWYPGLFMR
jgi:hypothetical protein